jgi:rubrerythrin
VSGDALALFLAHSRELEREAAERYTELAASLAAHHNREAARFFEAMGHEARRHLAEVEERSAGLELPDLDPWDYDWPSAEAPESASYEALHYRMSLREAMEIALRHERAAEHFYRGYSEQSENAAVRNLACEFAAEEGEHARLLEARLRELTETRLHAREDDDPPHLPE